MVKGFLKILAGNYADIKVLPFSDLCVKCSKCDQVKKLLCWDKNSTIPVTAELYKTKALEDSFVISNIPLDHSDEEFEQPLGDGDGFIVDIRRVCHVR